MNITNEAARIYIDSIDFTKIIDKLVNHGDWLEEDALKTCEQYRNFLFLNKKYQDQYPDLPPSEDMDEFWHNHILDTHAYIKDCQAIFGEYRHHYPYFGIDEKSNKTDLYNAFKKTNELYYKEFGEYIEATKSQFPAIIYSLLKKLQQLKARLRGRSNRLLDLPSTD